jgi:acyl-CoA thioesterase
MAPRSYFKDNGEAVSFEELMKLEKIDDHIYRSVTRGYAPTGGQNGTYGGHVYAQAAWAAAQTVEDGFLLHVKTLCA